jgi:hypothetical protein
MNSSRRTYLICLVLSAVSATVFVSTISVSVERAASLSKLIGNEFVSKSDADLQLQRADRMNKVAVPVVVISPVVAIGSLVYGISKKPRK